MNDNNNNNNNNNNDNDNNNSWSKARKIWQFDKATQVESVIWIKPEEIVQRIGGSTKRKCDTRCRGE